ncbi:hypothetical protein ACYBYS_19490 [Klebsiella pneumoniae]|uniref:hypothetical protein n=2 Tax=Klebsiella pneumoniae TaxID=573 RepID=UPI000B4B8358|nr:hypothetical protein [Klebsiella pneumoniae]ASC26546.1 hypothetical protein AM399_00925 [Klebsiella pneumoniae]ASC41254.1 hypothetical protein AM392_20135 [Klebsiella pneumoniae]EKM7480850.1 hypothetical protein [Klebsiella pneumoniae]EMB6036419.1 hypothetical protein [Klebsiella pneumoniae]MED7967805.1 hypothetical protein [Klebsiella pneumoniae]
MKLIKYWKVQLLKLSHSSGALCSRNPDDTLLFEGYSKDKPNIKLGTGLSIELFTAPDSVETCIFRDHLIDGALCIPVYEDDSDDLDDGTQEEQAEHEQAAEEVKPGKLIGNFELSGGAKDVLHALFFRGALEDGDLPSKSGASQLRKLGFIKTQNSAVSYRGASFYNFLTPAGQEFAMAYLADSFFGKPISSSFEDVVKPVIKWLNENANPHASAIVDATGATLFTGETRVHTEEFIKD